jgi:peptidoglycan/xylan/chitin deacetylase (PgdA/CDA1 family)/glycosyltransferase involved in cell wall biosynthesis
MRSPTKAAILSLGRSTGAFRLVGRSKWRTGRLAILCYHGISLCDEHKWRPGLYVSEQTFRRRMQMLVDGDYRVLPLAEALRHLEEGNLPPRSVALTFDDGFYDFHQLAFPVLKQFVFPATVYLTTYYADRKTPVFDVVIDYLLWRKRGHRFERVGEHLGNTLDLRTAESRRLCWQRIYKQAIAHRLTGDEKDSLVAVLAAAVGENYEQIREQRLMQIMSRDEARQIATGGMDIQLHTHRHRTPRNRELFIREVNDNRQIIAAITGQSATHFCYPSGVYAPDLFPWLKECGVQSAMTCDLGLVNTTSHFLAIPRILDSELISDVEFESWISGFRPFLVRDKMQRLRKESSEAVLPTSNPPFEVVQHEKTTSKQSTGSSQPLASTRERGRSGTVTLDSRANLSLLVVSYYFPPNSAVGSRRVARFCDYLPDFGIEPVVLTVDEESCDPIDHSFRLCSEARIERVRPHVTALDLYRHWKGIDEKRSAASAINHRHPGGEGKKTSSLRLSLIALLDFPDAFRGWYLPASRAAARIIENSHIDAVFSSGPPWTSHMIAHHISRRYNLPWIADFRDGWASNPWRKFLYEGGLPKWRDHLDLWTENRWIRRAKLVICTTDQQRQSLLGSHPPLKETRVVTILNGFDDLRELHVPPVKRERSTPRILLHAGNLYGARRVDTFCQAIETLIQMGRISPNDVKVILMGEADAEIEIAARNATPEVFERGIIEIQPQQPWETAQRATHNADVLLIFQGDHPTAIPAKFFEYLQTGKPILAVVGKGALREIVLNTRAGVVADPNDTAAIGAAIEEVLRARPRPREEVEQVASQFNFRKLTADLAQNIHEVLGPEHPACVRGVKVPI